MFILKMLGILFLLVVVTIVVALVIASNRQKKYEFAREIVEKKLVEMGFNIEKAVGMTAKVYVDNTNKQWAVSEWNEKTDVKIYKYVNLLDFELIEDEESVIKGAAGRALVGGALSGTTGAIIGSAGSKKIKQNCNLLEVRIRTDDFENPQYVIPYIKGFAVAKTSSMYKNSVESAQELISVLNYITSNGEKTASVSEVPETKSGVGERLRELNDLKNEGILTAEEFETEKKKILNGNG